VGEAFFSFLLLGVALVLRDFYLLMSQTTLAREALKVRFILFVDLPHAVGHLSSILTYTFLYYIILY